VSVLAQSVEAGDLLDRARAAAAIAAVHADVVDKDSRFPAEAVAALKSERLLGAMIAPQFGGEGAALIEIAEACAILGQACASTAMVFAMHQIKLSSVIMHGADSPWHRDLLRRTAREQLLYASATTEGGIGGDLRNSICAVVVEGEMASLEKDATVISYAPHADAILATARRHPDAPSSDQVLFCLMKDQYALEQTSVWDTLGMRGTCSDGWILKGRAPAAQILPKPFADIAAQSMLATSHLLWSAVWSGIASDAVARAGAFVRGAARKQPNVTPPGAQRLAEATLKLQSMRSAIVSAVDQYETARRKPDALSSVGFAVAMNNIKLASSRAVLDIIDECMLVCGILGYKNGTPFSLGRQLRDAHSARLMISNDRILINTANLLLVSRQESGLRG
jgi:acyl-CoA dehydrogenase